MKSIITILITILWYSNSFAQRSAAHIGYGFNYFHEIDKSGMGWGVSIDIPINNYLALTPMFNTTGSFETPVSFNRAIERYTYDQNSWLNKSGGLGLRIFKDFGKHKISILPFLNYKILKLNYSSVTIDGQQNIISEGVDIEDVYQYVDYRRTIYGASASYSLRIFPQWYMGVSYSRSFIIGLNEPYHYSVSATLSFVVPPIKKADTHKNE